MKAVIKQLWQDQWGNWLPVGKEFDAKLAADGWLHLEWGAARIEDGEWQKYFDLNSELPHRQP